MIRNKSIGKRCYSARLLFIMVLLNTVLPGSGQEYKVVRDLHLWTGVQIEKTFAKDWTLSLGEEIRFKHDISQINNYFTEAGLRYRISKNFALEGQYRFTRDKKKDNTYENLSRFALDLRYKGRLDFLSIYYRLRYQKEVNGMQIFDMSVPYEKYVRHRLTFRYKDFFRIKPYVSAEIFQLFQPGQNPEFEYVRLLGGVRYKHAKIGEFNVAYGFNREISSLQPAMIYLIKVNYTYGF
jgi:hypothetical protein